MAPIVVIPNHLPELEFLSEWSELFDADVDLIVVQDTGDAPKIQSGFADKTTVYTREDIYNDLGEDAWIIPERSSACRAYGYYKAWQRKPEFILTLDNDCYPEQDDPYWLAGHAANLSDGVTLDWAPSTLESMHVRGFPYGVRGSSPVAISHGLWSGVPDFDAPSQLLHGEVRFPAADYRLTIPRWNFFPMCGMNLAWRAELTPALHFGLHGLGSYGVDRFDDIWAGVFAKRICDHFGWAAVSGAPSVEHRKQSDVWENMKKEAPGFQLNEQLWQHVAAASLTASTVVGAYQELIEQLPDTLPNEPQPGYLHKLKLAMWTWAELFA